MLIYLVTFVLATSFVKIYDFVLPINLQKPNPYLFYKTCVFELKPHFSFAGTKNMPMQFTFLSKAILY